jgi:hypothetical protein
MHLNCRVRVSHDGPGKEGAYQTTGREGRLRGPAGGRILCSRKGEAKHQA